MPKKIPFFFFLFRNVKIVVPFQKIDFFTSQHFHSVAQAVDNDLSIKKNNNNIEGKSMLAYYLLVWKCVHYSYMSSF